MIFSPASIGGLSRAFKNLTSLSARTGSSLASLSRPFNLISAVDNFGKTNDPKQDGELQLAQVGINSLLIAPLFARMF